MNEAHDAAAFWGVAQNGCYSSSERLSCALAALDFFGGDYERREDSSEGVLLMHLGTDGRLVPIHGDMEDVSRLIDANTHEPHIFILTTPTDLPKN